MKKIDPAHLAWLGSDEIKHLVSALGAENIRFVGGAVRDSILGIEVNDVDVASILTPDVVIARLEFGGLKAIPTGIEHGTITALSGKQSFEVTTLRKDIKTDGRRAEVAFTDDWQEDAKRRDFTINALYLDVDGNIYDYFGGQDDLAQGKIKFIGNPQNRIEEDALRILRFFRFMARFGIDSGNAADLKAVVAEAKRLTFLSAERIRDEVKKLLLGKDCVPVLRLMMEKNVWQYILDDFDADGLERLVGVEAVLGEGDVYKRFARIFPNKTKGVRDAAQKLKLSNAERAHLLALVHPDPRIVVGMDDKDFRETTYRYGVAGFKDHALLNANVADAKKLQNLITKADGHTPPKFPVKGRDLLDMGIEAGPEMGELLGMLEERWIASDFLISKHDLLGLAKTPNLH